MTFFNTAQEFLTTPEALAYNPTQELLLTMLNQMQQPEYMF
jgi:hypothetical protein